MTDTPPPNDPTTHLVPARSFGRRRIAFNLLTVAAAFLGVGTSLLLQPDRWNRAAGYANLLASASTITWGSIYVAVALVMAAAVWRPTLRVVAVVAHTAGIALSLSWLIGFVVRYLTNDATTPLAVLAWGAFLAALIRSAIVLDDGYEPVALIHRRKAP